MSKPRDWVEKVWLWSFGVFYVGTNEIKVSQLMFLQFKVTLYWWTAGLSFYTMPCQFAKFEKVIKLWQNKAATIICKVQLELVFSIQISQSYPSLQFETTFYQTFIKSNLKKMKTSLENHSYAHIIIATHYGEGWRGLNDLWSTCKAHKFSGVPTCS